MTDDSDLGPSARDFLQRLTQQESLEDLRKALDTAQKHTDKAITGALTRLGAGSNG